MRGKPLRFLVFDPCGRIIPAHAGQTTIFSFNSARWSDHPRACGANGVWGVFNIRGHGSSPRMRGKPAVIYPRLGARRIIPAHAGQTEKSHQKQWFAPDHPRACGANSASNEAAMTRFGSSPRMRGKRMVAGIWQTGRRIIPAHAGQTPPSTTRDTCRPDHPRACGANLFDSSSSTHAVGSSPRMRGKQGRVRADPIRRRIIPAHAGQTRTPSSRSRPPPDHPRACGANYNGTYSTFDDLGSSPRMRGKRQADRRGRGPDRIIPAHAGQTYRRCRRYP